MTKPALHVLLQTALLLGPAYAQNIPVQEVVLDNGMKFLLVRRYGDPDVAAGWLAKVGSANERPGITGISHLIEHMMFKGTHTMGTSNIQQELKLIKQIDEIKVEMRKEERLFGRLQRLGETEGDMSKRSLYYQQLRSELLAMQKKEQHLLVPEELERTYMSAGAAQMNAWTDWDSTVYYINIPSNKLELWFWLESDRLAHPVFREFYAEQAVVQEEHRWRTENTPLGKFEEQFEALFWQSSPYSWPIDGWTSDVKALNREEARTFFELHYAPVNLTACLVGDFDLIRVAELARRYFGRLKPATRELEPVRTREIAQQAMARMIACAETNPRVVIRYHTVPAGHKDEPALTILSSMLNGQTGRLYRSLVLQQDLASSVAASHVGARYEGYFELEVTPRPEKRPEEVEQAIYRELDNLKRVPIGDKELQRLKDLSSTSFYRSIQSDFSLMIGLLVAEGGPGWKHLGSFPGKVEAVTPTDVTQAAMKYLSPQKGTVAVYYRKGSELRAPGCCSSLPNICETQTTKW